MPSLLGWHFLFLLMEFINVNGKIVPRDEASIRVDDHSYRYGNGLFETMKVLNGKILLSDFHFERLFEGLYLLKFQVSKLFTRIRLEKEILQLCKKNNCESIARIRLSVSPGYGGLYDANEKLQYRIESWPLRASTMQLNDNGLVIDVFPYAQKSCDRFSGLKSASHLAYAMGARFAKENKLNDCLLLNSHNRICDSTIANIFWIKSGLIYTPPLSEGCIAGVMRKFLINSLSGTTYKVFEKHCQITALEKADEIFLTNAIRGIQWVRRFRDTLFGNVATKKIHDELSQRKSE